MNITIIGVGLIGGSLAKSLKIHNFADEVIGFGRNEANLALAKELGIIDNWTTDMQTACQSDIIVLATPVGVFNDVLKQIQPFVKNQIFTDVGSTKQSVEKSVVNILGSEVSFVAAHPIAGKEKSGCKNADKDLFQNKKVIITSGKEKSKEIIKKMWQITGAIVDEMSPQTHDNIFGLTSHLPHLLAFGFVHYMSSQKGSEHWTGGGFKDFTRIASSDSKMWADIFENNESEVLKHLENYQQELTNLANLIKTKDKKSYQQYFLDAKNNRDGWLK